MSFYPAQPVSTGDSVVNRLFNIYQLIKWGIGYFLGDKYRIISVNQHPTGRGGKISPRIDQ